MWKRRIKFLFSSGSLKNLYSHFIMVLGTLWLFTEIIDYFFQNLIGNRVKVGVLFGFIAVALAWTIKRSFPPLKYNKLSRASNVEIEVKVGDLLSEPTNIAIGCSDCFDSEAPHVIGPESLMAQLVRTSFGGQHAALDAVISKHLNDQQITSTEDSNKKFGKNCRYPIGTVAVLDVNNRKVFLTVFSRSNIDKTTTTTKEDLWTSLSELWTAVRREGFLRPIAVPVWGAGLARFHASRISLIQILLLSFVVATRESKVSQKLSLIIYEGDYNPIEMREAIELIDSLDF